jgi:hypothetical protein
MKERILPNGYMGEGKGAPEVGVKERPKEDRKEVGVDERHGGGEVNTQSS